MAQTTSSLIKKLFMALTGLFLAFFLIIHLLGNLQLLLPENVGHLQFNAYSHFLGGNALIKLVSYVLYFSIIYHVFEAVVITSGNWKANDTRYKKDNRQVVSGWVSRNMGVLGSLILIFLILHFRDYWYVYKFGELPTDEAGNKDLYLLVISSFKELWYVVIYVIAMLVLGLHLWHGVNSAFRTLGVYHQKYMQWIKLAGYAFSIAISVGFAIIPVIVYLKSV